MGRVPRDHAPSSSAECLATVGVLEGMRDRDNVRENKKTNRRKL